MAKKVRMLRTYASAENMFVEGKVYNISDALYAVLSPLNHAGEPIFDNEPELEFGEKVLKQDAPDPGDKDGEKGGKIKKAPVFTAATPEPHTTQSPTPFSSTPGGKPK